jgi:uncharacterized membrane protein
MSKRMRGILLWITITFGLALAVHLAAIFLYPRALMWYVEGKVTDRKGANVLAHRKPPSPEDRVVVAPCPDLIYSVGVFDVSQGPVRITAPFTGSYLSLSLYAANTDNFFVVNDRQVAGQRLDVVLLAPNAPDPALSGPQVVRAPTKTGIILLRYFAGGGKRAEEIAKLQQQATCTVLH